MPGVKRIILKPSFLAMTSEQRLRRRGQRNHRNTTSVVPVASTKTPRRSPRHLEADISTDIAVGGDHGLRWSIRIDRSSEFPDGDVIGSLFGTSGNTWLLTPRNGPRGANRHHRGRWASRLDEDDVRVEDANDRQLGARAVKFRGGHHNDENVAGPSVRVAVNSIRGRSHKLGRTANPSNFKRQCARFSVVAKLTILCRRLSLSPELFRNNAIYHKIAPYLHSLQFRFESIDLTSRELMFDRSKFKANRRVRIFKRFISRQRLLVAEEPKKIMLKPSWQRTEKELAFLVRSLHDIKAFAELPIRMQNKVAEVGKYERYGTQKLILMQHDPAHSFYFILSGSVEILLTEDDSSITRPAATMTRGMTFGELALITRSRRQSTIIVREDVELMSIDLEDYHKIFMLGGTRNVTDPDHLQFLHGLSFLDGWPIERMSETSTKCIYHYFKRGEILVRNSQMSTWIVVIKSGSLNVLKKLKRIDSADLKAYVTQSKTERLPVIEDPLLQRRKKRLQQKQKLSKGHLLQVTSTPPIQTVSTPDKAIPSPPPASHMDHHDLDTAARPRQRPHGDVVRPRQRRHAVATRDELIELSVARVLGGRPTLLTTGVGAIDENANETGTDDKDDGYRGAQDAFQRRDFSAVEALVRRVGDNEDCVSDGGLSTSSTRTDSRCSSSHGVDASRRRHRRTVGHTKDARLSQATAPAKIDLSSVTKLLDFSVWSNSRSGLNGHEGMTSSSGKSNSNVDAGQSSRPLTRLKSKEFREQHEQEATQKQQMTIRTIAADIDSYRDYLASSSELTEADFNPEFVHVQTLVRGQVFPTVFDNEQGLVDVILGAQPTLSVLSNGAECILLDKQFYMQHAPEALLRRLRLHECCPYPTDDVMQRKLLLSVQWAKYRQNALNDVISEKYHHKQLLDRAGR